MKIFACLLTSVALFGWASSLDVERGLQSFTGRVTRFELYNADTDVKIGDIVNGSTYIIPTPTGLSLNVRAVTSRGSGSSIRSVGFVYGTTFARNDNASPYSFCGNSGSNYDKCTQLGYGTHTITATPYSGTSTTGTAGTSLKLTFVVSSSAAPVKAPTKAPTIAPAKSPTKVPTKSPTTTPTKAPIFAPVTSPTNAPTKSPTKAPTKAPTKSPTRAPTKAPTKAPVKSPTKAPTKAPSSVTTSQPITYVPGKATVRQNGMVLSQGLTSRLIAQSGQPVRFANGQQSSSTFHTFPDGAAVFKDPASGSYKYVSNSEASSNGGVGSITFDQHGNVTGYERLQSGTVRNCGGGKTFWNTWLTCEEWSGGHVWEIDPFAKTARRTLLASPYQAPWESAAYDNRDPTKPTFYVTADKSNGALLRFTSSAAAVATARVTNNYSQLLHTAAADNKWEYLVLSRLTATSGTFSWTTNVATAEASAGSLYKASEGIDIRNGFLYFTCKTDKLLFILNLDQRTYVVSSTVSGAFNGQPDQVARLLDDVDQDILYFCEDVGTFAGVHGRDANGKYYTIVQGELGALDGETSGLAFGPGNMLMYVSFQTAGKIFEIRRTDGRPFSGQRLDIKYHDDGTNPNPF